MPIKGLTDRGLAFAQIGVIRKGAPKDESKNRPGADLKYFRVVFDEAEQDSAKRFLEAYGQMPTRINVVFPFNDIDQIAQFWLEAYTAGRMIARSDGQVYQYRVDPKTGEVLVKNGLNIKTGQPEPFIPDQPVGYYRNNKGQEEPVYCRGVGRIRVVVPELQRLAYLLLMTTSIHDIANLSEQLQGIWETNKGHIAGIPFILQRKPRKVSCPDLNDPTKRVRREKWLLSIEAHPEWVAAKMLAMKKDAFMLEAPRKPLAALPTGNPIQAATSAVVPDEDWTNTPVTEDWNEDDEPVDGEFEEDAQPGSVPDEKPATPADDNPTLFDPGPKDPYAAVKELAKTNAYKATYELAQMIGWENDDINSLIRDNKGSDGKPDWTKVFQGLLRNAPPAN